MISRVRDLQVVLGHSHLETTMNYLHPETDKVVSPLKAFSTTPQDEQKPHNGSLQRNEPGVAESQGPTYWKFSPIGHKASLRSIR